MMPTLPIAVRNVIPVQNVYYLLAYAWSHFRSGEEVNVDESQCPDSHNLLAMLLDGGIRRLATQGFDKGYLNFTESTPRLRGRVDIVGSHRRMTHISGRMICEFDELSADTVANQILKATCRRLSNASSELSDANRKGIRHCLGLLNDISDYRITSRSFRRVQLHRNNRQYRLLLHVCQLLYKLYLPDQQAGSRRFRDLQMDEMRMEKLFEDFILAFANRHIKADKIWAMQMKWDGDWSEESSPFVPKMRTDVTIDRPNRKTILDCKYYIQALLSNFGQDRVRSKHLYQLTAYLRNKAVEPGWESVRGILLYPTVRPSRNLDLFLQGHEVEIRFVDLAQRWEDIHESLLQILN